MRAERILPLWVLFSLCLLGLAPRAHAQALRLLLDTSFVNMPIPDAYSLDAGFVENGNGQGVYALRIEVDGPVGTGWSVYLRSTDPYFTPQSMGKSALDLKWKFDQEGANAYRPLTIQEQPVVRQLGGGPFAKNVDFLLLLDWSTPPASYGLNLVFTLVAE